MKLEYGLTLDADIITSRAGEDGKIDRIVV